MSALDRVSSASRRIAALAGNPWTITDLSVPAGSNRLLVDVAGFVGAAATGDVLDPGGGNEQALTKSEKTSITNEALVMFTLLEADLPAAGDYDLALTHPLAGGGPPPHPRLQRCRADHLQQWR